MSTSTAGMSGPYAIHDGLAVYRFGNGRPVLLMPGPHRFQQPGHRSADALIAGLTRLGRQIITFDPPGSGHSTRPARLGMPEMHQCADEALEIGGAAGPVDALGVSSQKVGANLFPTHGPLHRGTGTYGCGCPPGQARDLPLPQDIEKIPLGHTSRSYKLSGTRWMTFCGRRRRRMTVDPSRVNN
jgi:hypothetical protein